MGKLRTFQACLLSFELQYNNTIQYDKNLFKHGKIIQYKKNELKLIYKIAVGFNRQTPPRLVPRAASSPAL